MKATFFIIFLFFVSICINLKIDAQTKIYITELLPDAIGSDSGKEFIELYSIENLSTKDWYIINTSQSGTTKKVNLPETSINKDTYFLIAEDLNIYTGAVGISIGSGRLAFYNDYGKIQLFNAQANLLAEVSYGDSKEGASWESRGLLCSELQISLENSAGFKNKGEINSCTPQPVSYINKLEITKIEFSLDNLNWVDTLTTFVNTPIYLKYELSQNLIVDNVKFKDSSGLVLDNPFKFSNAYKGNITVEATYNNTVISKDSMQIEVQNNISSKVLITEIYASPDSGDKEWIEIFNNDTSTINLNDYFIEEKTSTGISKNKFELPSIFIAPNEYKIIDEDSFSVSLNNSGDTIYLFDKNLNQIDSFNYSEVDKSKAVGRKLINGEFSEETYELLTPTPNQPNKFSDAVTSQISSIEQTESFGQPTLANFKDFKSGTELSLSVLVNNYIDKYIFISDSTSHLKAKLDSTISDEFINANVKLSAKVFSLNGVKNLLINSESIEIVDYVQPIYNIFNSVELSKENIGEQYELNGVVTEVYANRYKLQTDSGVITVYSKEASVVNKGVTITVNGTLDFYRNSFRIIEIDNFQAQVLAESTNKIKADTLSYAKSNIIESDLQQSSSRDYLILFGVFTLVIVCLSELIRARKYFKKILIKFKKGITNTIQKFMIKY